MSVFDKRGPEKKNSHEITIRVRFNKPVSRAAAQRALKNQVCDQEFCASLDENERDDWRTCKIAKTCSAK